MGMKKTEIGMIPEDWDVQRFSDTFRILNNNTYSRAELNYASGQFRNIHYGDVLILFPEVLDCTREDVPYINDEVRISGSAQPLQDGDVVMADTAEDETVGKVTEVTNTSDKPVKAGLHTIPFRVKSGEFVPKWLGYYMNSHLYHDQLLPYIHGTKVSSVSKGSLGDTVIIVPKTSEQEKIVNALSDVDALIEDLKKLIRKKKDVLYGSMQKLMTGEIRLQGFSEEWELVEIGSVAKVIDPHPSHRAPEAVEYGIPFVGIGDIDEEGNINKKSARIVDESVYAEHSQRYDLSKNLIGIGRVASLGKVIRLRNDIGEYAISPTMAVIDFESIDPMFAYYYMRSSEFQNQFTSSSNGSTRQSVGMHYIRNLNIRKPSPEEQVELSQCLGDMDYEIRKLEEKCSKYQKVKQGMMEELLTGKVRLM